MPGTFTRPPLASETWTRDRWAAYRASVASACARWPEWERNVGRALVRLADRNLERLDADAEG